MPGIYELNHLYRVAEDAPTSLATNIAAEACGSDLCLGRAMIGWDNAAGRCGAQVRVGLVDTAVNLKHQALRDSKITARSFTAPDQIDAADGHGTAIAALMVSTDPKGVRGLMPAAELFAANAFYQDEKGGSAANVVSLLDSLNWLASQKVAVINMSLAGPPNIALGATIKRLENAGILVVAAAGNGGRAAPTAYPAGYETVVAVTAVDSRRRPYRHANRGDYLSLAAPGVKIWAASDNSDGKFHYGTSFAAPFVTAIAAGMIQPGQKFDPRTLRKRLRQGTVDLGARGKDPIFGWGLIQSGDICPGR